MTIDLTKTDPAGGAGRTPVPGAARRAKRAAARSAGGDRWLLALVGLVLLAAGTLVALLSYGVFGTRRASRPVLDPMVVDEVVANPLLWRLVAIGAGLLLVVLGLVWAARSLRPERRPDVVVDARPGTAIVVDASAVADAVAERTAAMPGVGRARARLVGTETDPALRLTVWLADDADVRDVLRRLDEVVLTQARDSFGLASLPVAVRLDLEQPAHGPRVS